MEIAPTCLSVLPRRADAVEVAVQPVHRGPADMQPTPAIDPWSPFTGTAHPSLGPGNIAGQVLECIDVESGSVVQAKVEVGLLCVLPTSPATTEHYLDHAVHLTEPLRELAQLPVVDHPHIMSDLPALSRCQDLDRKASNLGCFGCLNTHHKAIVNLDGVQLGPAGAQSGSRSRNHCTTTVSASRSSQPGSPASTRSTPVGSAQYAT